jgi:hypothetical protein
MTFELIIVVALIAGAVYVNIKGAHLRRLSPEPAESAAPSLASSPPRREARHRRT